MADMNKIYDKHHSESRDIEKTSFGDIKGDLFKDAVGQKKVVLDIGCRSGALANYFLKTNKIYGVDVDKKALLSAKKKGLNVKYLNLNEYNEELEKVFNLKSKFDVVTAGDVIEHIYFPEEKTKQIANSLKPNGKFIGNVPNAFFFMHRLRYLLGNYKGTPLEDPTHINQFSFEQLDTILKKYFEVVEYKPIIDNKYKFLTKFSKSLFYYGIFFVASKPKKNVK